MRYFSSILLSVFCLLFLSLGTAAAFGEIRYPDRSLNLRSNRSAQGDWVGLLAAGQKVRVAYMENGWFAVFEPGETRDSEEYAVGYTNSKYLKAQPIKVETLAWGKANETISAVPIRTKASALSKKVGDLEAGTPVISDFSYNEWVMVFPATATIRSKMGALGFVKASQLKKRAAQSVPVPVVSTKKEKDTRDIYTEWGTVVKVSGVVELYRERTRDSRKVKTLGPGQKVRIDFPANGWVAVFKQDERLRKEYRAIGYAPQSSMQPASKAKVSFDKAISDATGGKARKTVVIDKKRIVGGNRPDPKPDRKAGGFSYKLLRKGQGKMAGETWISLRVFVAVDKAPDRDVLMGLATALWKQHRSSGKNLAVLVYLPGMNTEDIAYGVYQFSEDGLIESWVRRTTLLGTKFM